MLSLKQLRYEGLKLEALESREGIRGLKLVRLEGHSPGMIGFMLEDLVFVADAIFGDKLLSLPNC